MGGKEPIAIEGAKHEPSWKTRHRDLPRPLSGGGHCAYRFGEVAAPSCRHAPWHSGRQPSTIAYHHAAALHLLPQFRVPTACALPCTSRVCLSNQCPSICSGTAGQHSAAYQQINPAELVPPWWMTATPSRSRWPSWNIWKSAPAPPCCQRCLGRARVRALAQTIACEIHPLNNLRVLQYLERELKMDEEPRPPGTATGSRWALPHWNPCWPIAPTPGRFAMATSPGLADCCLVPQLANLRRFATPLEAFPPSAGSRRFALRCPRSSVRHRPCNPRRW